MAKSQRNPLINPEKRLEMTMRDVGDNLTDSACYFAYRSTPHTLQILSIESPKPCNFDTPLATIIPVHTFQSRSRDIVDFLVRRETELERRSAN